MSDTNNNNEENMSEIQKVLGRLTSLADEEFEGLEAEIEEATAAMKVLDKAYRAAMEADNAVGAVYNRIIDSHGEEIARKVMERIQMGMIANANKANDFVGDAPVLDTDGNS